MRASILAADAMMHLKIVATALILATSFLWVSHVAAQETDPRVAHGAALARSLCGQCHATGRSDASPHAGAPRLRALSERLDLDTFVDRLRQGLISGHPDMPTFRFAREDAQALVAYLRSIQLP